MVNREDIKRAANSKWGPWIGVLLSLVGLATVYFEYRTADAEAEAAKIKATKLEETSLAAEVETGKQFDDHQDAIEAVFYKSLLENKKMQLAINKGEFERTMLQNELESMWEDIYELQTTCVKKRRPRTAAVGAGGGGGVGATYIEDEVPPPTVVVALPAPKERKIRAKVDEERDTLLFRKYDKKFLQQSVKVEVNVAAD